MDSHKSGDKPEWQKTFYSEYWSFINNTKNNCKNDEYTSREDKNMIIYLLREQDNSSPDERYNFDMTYELSNLRNAERRADSGKCKTLIQNLINNLTSNLNRYKRILNSHMDEYQKKINYYAQIEQDTKNEVQRKQRELADIKKKSDEQIEEKLNKLISDNKLKVVYRNGTFLVTKNSAGQYVYIKDVSLRKPSDVRDEINSFNLYQKMQIESERQSKDIKNKNLAHRWVVQAQAVCSGGSSCQITGISEGQRLEDGSATFSISYQTWRGSGGSSGVATINCGFNQSNTLRSTSVNAVCQ